MTARTYADRIHALRELVRALGDELEADASLSRSQQAEAAFDLERLVRDASRLQRRARRLLDRRRNDDAT